MDQITFAVGICAVQASLISVVGLLAGVIVHRRPLFAKTIGCTALAVIAALTITLPIPVPGWKLHNLSFLSGKNLVLGQRFAQMPTQASTKPQSELGSYQTPADRSLEPAGMLGLGQIMQGVARLAQRTAEQRSPTLVWYIPLGILALISLGGIKFCWGLHYANRIVRRSRPLAASRANLLLQALQPQICPGTQVKLVQSEQLASAAVSGVWRPTILLPARWGQWSDHQLRCVLAHELAHIQRHDFGWRLVSCSVAIVHYYNPLVHLLVRSLSFSQESAADRLAAQVVGHQRYVRALSSLALEHDQPQSCFTKAGLHPVFSGYLIRRIKMLRSTKDWGISKESLVPSRIAMGVMLSIGATLFAARGLAQQETITADDSQPTARLARLGDRGAKPPIDPTAGMFQRQPTNLDVIPANDSGVIKIRLAELLDSLQVGPSLQPINALASGGLQDWFQSSEPINFDVQQIDSLMGMLQFVSQYNAEAEDNKHSISFGSNGMQVSLKEELDLASWVQRYLPDADVTEVRGQKQYALPELPAIGPVPFLVASKDPKTLCFGAMMLARTGKGGDPSSAEVLDAAVQHDTQPNASAWAAGYRSVDGGLITIAATNKWVSKLEEFQPEDDMDAAEQAANLAYQRIEHTFETLALGLDVSQDGKTIGIRLRLACSDEVASQMMADDARLLVRYGRQQVADDSPAGQAADALTTVLSQQFLQRMVIEQGSSDEGSFEVVLRSAVDCPDALGQLLIQELISSVGGEQSVTVRASASSQE